MCVCIIKKKDVSQLIRKQKPISRSNRIFKMCYLYTYKCIYSEMEQFLFVYVSFYVHCRLLFGFIDRNNIIFRDKEHRKREREGDTEKQKKN